MNKKAFWAGALLSAIFATQTVSAASVTQCGPNICYAYDDAQTAVGLYGTPTLVGDALRFLPEDFRAQSDDGQGLVSTTASFFFDNVYSVNPNEFIKEIQIYEFGDYEVTNGDSVSDELTLDAVNNLGAGAASGSELFGAGSHGASTGIQNWQIENTLDVNSEFMTNSLNLTVTNLLQASTDVTGESAWIQKKVEIQAVAAVPLPAGAWLMISALGAVGGWARRNKKA
jgi:hypothetical protein